MSLFRKSFAWTIQILLLIAPCLPAQEVGVVWSGTYNGRYYPPKVYTKSDLCCNSTRCKMRETLIELIDDAEEAQRLNAVAPPKASSAPGSPAMEAYWVNEPYTAYERQCYKVGRKTYCKTVEVTRYRQVKKFRPIKAAAKTAAVAAKVAANVVNPKKAPNPTFKVLEVDASKLALAFDPTPPEVVDAILEQLQPQPGEVLADLGCGDGRILKKARTRYRCRAVGVEFNPETFKKAEDNVGDVEGIELIEGDVLKEKVEADIVVMYLYPDLLAEVWKTIEPGTVVCSINHELPGRCRKCVSHGYSFYIGVKAY